MWKQFPRTKVLTNFPELKAYMWYQAPYYKVKAGNFTSRNDAQAYQKEWPLCFRKYFYYDDIVVNRRKTNLTNKVFLLCGINVFYWSRQNGQTMC